MKKSHDNVFTIGIGGAAGDGIRESGNTLSAILAELGYESFLSFTYPSLIRGGHNFARLTFSKEKIYSDHQALDVLIALNEESITLHRDEMAHDSVVFADSFEPEDIEILKDNAVVMPMAITVKEMNASPITRNSMALGALCYLLDLDFALMQKVLNDVFKNKQPEVNIKLVDMGYEIFKKKDFRHSKKIQPSVGKKEFIDGNSALAKGLMVAGLDFYIGYPMTPATGILQYLAGQQNVNCEVKPHKVRTIQPESELAVINMALGISYAGKRVAIGSATGGFALMQEAFSFAGMAELPLVIAVSQRQGPATGLPTYSSQTDLRFVLHAGHGEFPRIVLAPGDQEEAFYLGAEALNLAWKYQVPVIVLMDKIISEHSSTCLLKSDNIKIESGLISQGAGAIGNERVGKSAGEEISESAGSITGEVVGNGGIENVDVKTTGKYGRYEITKDGISPMAFPGTPNTTVKITSYEHDAYGITVDEPSATETMLSKRFAKSETIRKSLDEYETVKVYGDTSCKDVIVFWGSTKGPVLEALRYVKKPVKLVQIVWIEPFDSKRVTQELKGAQKIISIECNHDGQMAGLIREKTGIEVTDKILKYDAQLFEPMELAEQINSLCHSRESGNPGYY